VLGILDHAFAPSGLWRVIERHCDFARLEECGDSSARRWPQMCRRGTEVVLSHGPVVEAVLASAAIPGCSRGSFGTAGCSCTAASSTTRRLRMPSSSAPTASSSSPPLDRRGSKEASCGALSAGITAITRAITRRLEEDVARYGELAHLTVLPAPTLQGLLPMDFGHADELIEQGMHHARVELRCHRAPVQSLRRAA
jgi:NTE family protein